MKATIGSSPPIKLTSSCPRQLVRAQRHWCSRLSRTSTWHLVCHQCPATSCSMGVWLTWSPQLFFSLNTTSLVVVHELAAFVTKGNSSKPSNFKKTWARWRQLLSQVDLQGNHASGQTLEQKGRAWLGKVGQANLYPYYFYRPSTTSSSWCPP